MGLLRGLARTPVKAGSATAVSHRVDRRQALLWLERIDGAADLTGSLERLMTLYDLGLLREEEFLTARVRMLGS
jgi:hypothetical protein